jgi:hypothetical protein
VLGSVQIYCKGIVDGLAMPQGVQGPMVARITAPLVEKVGPPKAYLWGGRVASSRQTAPRGPGMRKFPWSIDVTLMYLDNPDNALANEPFPRVIDAVMWAFMTTKMPTWISKDGDVVGPNAETRTDTQIQAIGENFDLDYPPERTVTAQRQLLYVARLSVSVLEVVQA